jgi:hypothetical protein
MRPNVQKVFPPKKKLMAPGRRFIYLEATIKTVACSSLKKDVELPSGLS